MKINDLDLPRNQGIQTKKTSKSSSASKTGSASSSSSASSSGRVTDSVNVSEAGKQMRTFRAHYEAIPEVKTERLAALKDEVDSGNYHPPAEKIASAILDFVQHR
ncbi:MAG: flagellar biosynthesis anti-sigma factor FlgM [Deltaproteobacteria bacterium]|nr:MAG: flagellar biosynthesis anti-sigma factor FlgM [Deltaproteobacteria bacterium]